MPTRIFARARPWLWKIALSAGLAVIVIVLMLWLAGRFSPKLTARAPAVEEAAAVRPEALVPVRLVTLPASETAAGTIAAVHETRIASKLLARVVEVNLKAGQAVESGQVLVRLDDKDVRARLQRAEAQVAAAQAHLEQAQREEKRLASVIGKGAASEQEYDRARTAVAATEAELRAAQEQVNEAQAIVEYTVIRAPMDGVVIDKRVEAGDLVTPGQVLLTFYDPTRMQLVASVRESLAHRLAVGQEIGVQVDVLNKTCSGVVSEIVPEAESASRTFQVKVTGPCPPGIYSGMFGRIIIPLADEQVLVVPKAAIEKVGQLELVQVWDDGALRRRAVRTGRSVGNDVEVLSGLRQGEQVAQVAPGSAEGA